MFPMHLLRDDPLPWLLEPDPTLPSVRYFALRDLLDRPADDPDVRAARAAIMASGPVPVILAAQQPDGWWAKPGTGYSPKYRATDWQLIILAELGADPTDARVRRGGEYALSHGRTANGAFSYNAKPTPASMVHCLNGNLLYALMRLGFENDPRVHAVLDWLTRAVTGEEGMIYYRSGTVGPGFACGDNGGLPCAWGAARALKALAGVPDHLRTPPVQRAIQVCVDFLFSRNPAVADYPFIEKVSTAWFKLGFPVGYWSDVLDVTDLLATQGYGRDPRLAGAVEWVLRKQDEHGRWKMRNALAGKMWAEIEPQGAPSKWVTLRALRLLKHLDSPPIA